ncbi:MAG: hypothetical protein ACR2HJ_13045 [Fimbriimonadales bacterium]
MPMTREALVSLIDSASPPTGPNPYESLSTQDIEEEMDDPWSLQAMSVCQLLPVSLKAILSKPTRLRNGPDDPYWSFYLFLYPDDLESAKTHGYFSKFTIAQCKAIAAFFRFLDATGVDPDNTFGFLDAADRWSRPTWLFDE